MKIARSVRELYAEQVPLNDRLRLKVDETLRSIASRRRWHYESRIKSEESYALKLESGRIPDPRNAEDFFACTLVVQNLSAIAEAEQEMRCRFTIVARRPYDANRTHKGAETFPFDDLRLYGYWKDDPSLPETGLSSVKFEIQIKTFLQHAWGIATHDLIYKTDDVSWSRQRIAYQIKAMLEHAEISIQEADRLAEASALAMKQRETEELKEIIGVLQATWRADLLPPDLRRLAENTRSVMKLAKLKIKELKYLIDSEQDRQKGSLPINLSPYSIIVQAIAWHKPESFKTGLANRELRNKIFITDEMETPDWMTDPTLINIVRAVKLETPTSGQQDRLDENTQTESPC